MQPTRAIVPLLSFVAAATTALGAQAPTSGDRAGSVVVGGVTRTYVYHVPPTLGKRVPLILVFHGHYMTGEQQSKMTHLDPLADRRGFIVVYPNGIRRGWNDGRRNKGVDDLGFLHALIATFAQRYPIDRKRIYVTGFSNGATFSEIVGCTQADTIAAIAPVSGPLAADMLSSCHPQRPISVLAIEGTADPLVPYGGGQVHILGFARGAVLSIRQTIDFWKTNAHCTIGPRETALPPIPPGDGTRVTRTAFAGCTDDAAVQLYTITGGGHAWPQGPQYLPKAVVGIASTQLDADGAIVDFFYAHPLP
ncbi:MAG TPA: PHB depolymerase family esterase [Candidatus Sulfotelmatobacter sp.]|nr:PHB depolymerase family esterase [Candidatus Sulfotelmatobacter sp.]